MNVFISKTLEKQLDDTKNQQLLFRFDKVVGKLLHHQSPNDLYSDKGLGTKKFKGLKNNSKTIIGIDLNNGITAERIIATYIDTEAEKQYFQNYIPIKTSATSASIILHLYCEHDLQQNKAYQTAKQAYNYHEYLPVEYFYKKEEIELIDNSVKLNSLYAKFETPKYNNPRTAVLTSDKIDIVNKFISDRKPMLLSGIAGSGKTEIGIRLMHQLTEDFPDLSILYITYAEKLLKDVKEKCFFDCKNINFKTIKNFLSEQIKHEIEFDNIIIFNIFLKYYLNRQDNIDFNLQKRIAKFIKEKTTYSIYSEIYGIITGSMLDWNREHLDIIPIQSYASLTNDYKLFNTEEDIKLIYDLTKEYLSYIYKNKISTRNEASLKIISMLKNNYNIKKYDYIIVDEAQDLTECEIFALFHCLSDPNNFFIASDRNQIINPTFFKPERINSMFYTAGVSINKPQYLTENFRNSKAIVNLINYVNELRNNKLEKRKQEERQMEISRNNSIGDIYSFQNSIYALGEFIDSANVICITNEKDSITLKEQFGEASVTTVEEIKGMEFDNVVLYNIISHNKNIFNILYTDCKKENYLQYYFNLYYVGLTRTKYNLILVEDDKSYLYSDILSNVSEISIINNTDDIKLQKDKSAISYFIRGKKFKESKQYKIALANFNKSKKYYDTTISLHELEKEIDICNICLNEISEIKQAEIFEKKEYFEEALSIYKEVNNYKKTAVLSLILGRDDEFYNLILQKNIDIFQLYGINDYYDKKLDKYFTEKFANISSTISSTREWIKEISYNINNIKF